MARQSALQKQQAKPITRNHRLRSLGGHHDSTVTELDRLIHERTRLAILSALAVNDSLTFNELKKSLNVSDGNLSVHSRKLEEAGYVSCTKSFEGRMPRTAYRLTTSGRTALQRYINHMESLIRALRDR